MLKDLLSLLPYSIGIAFSIVFPALIIAFQEQEIEGPFGWSSLTFTKRWPVNSIISKIYRACTGKDKWATKYHLMSNIIWVMIFFMSLLYIPMFSFFAKVRDPNAFVIVAGVAIFCCVQLMWVEDYVWFLTHKYYGPKRHTGEYVPWFQHFKAGIPTAYWGAIIGGLIIMVIVHAITGDVSVLMLWGETMLFLLITVFFIIKPIGMKMERLSLRKFWWEYAKNVIIVRSPYSVEKKDPLLSPEAFVINDATLKELVETGKAVKLERALKK